MKLLFRDRLEDCVWIFALPIQTCVSSTIRTDDDRYLVGTEDGNIHKCSCSYNEQYLETYSNHSGPVYKVRWSPFCGGIFLSCSADWSMKLWDEEQTDSKARNPRIAFESVNVSI